MVEKDGSAYECIDVKSVGKNGHEKHLNLTRFRFETVTISKDGIENIENLFYLPPKLLVEKIRLFLDETRTHGFRFKLIYFFLRKFHFSLLFL